MTCREYVRANLRDLAKLGFSERLEKISRETGVGRERARKSYRMESRDTPPVTPDTPAPVPRTHVTRQELINAYDTDLQALNKIREILPRLEEDADRLFTTAGFWAEFMASVPWKAFKKISGYPEFREYRVKIDGVVYWASKSTRNWALARITKAREC